MEAFSVKFILILMMVNGYANCDVQGSKGVEDEEKIPSGEGIAFPVFIKSPVILKKVRDQLPELIKNISTQTWKAPPETQGSGSSPGFGLGIGNLYNTLLGGVHSLYQDLVNRQQAFINLLTCGNCVNEGWDAIMEVALTVPELEWVYKPSEKQPATFFTAIHQNGTVAGIGGSVQDGKPVAEYAFGNDGIIQHLPQKNKKDNNTS